MVEVCITAVCGNWFHFRSRIRRFMPRHFLKWNGLIATKAVTTILRLHVIGYETDIINIYLLLTTCTNAPSDNFDFSDKKIKVKMFQFCVVFFYRTYWIYGRILLRKPDFFGDKKFCYTWLEVSVTMWVIIGYYSLELRRNIK